MASITATTNTSKHVKQGNNNNHITVIGIGAMGGGMARALLEESDDVAAVVTGYDRNTALVQQFHAEAVAAGKAATPQNHPPASLQEAVTSETNVVVLVLLNEAQCEQVCFGGGAADSSSGDQPCCCLLDLLTAPDCCVICCATVTPAWAVQASQRFASHKNSTSKNIHFVDCPTSGGPARARRGELTLMVSSDQDRATPQQERVVDAVLEALGAPQHVHYIAGGAGLGSTVKLVHQLLAGVHLCVAAEALALAAAAGLDVRQVYDIVNGAAGASWMFQDRGPRMMMNNNNSDNNTQDDVKSMLSIFVKDLDIVYAEAKRLQSPIPLASAALQQFISGQSLGLGRCDDSQVVQVYENVTGQKVARSSSSSRATTTTKKEEEGGDEVGDFWVMEDGVTKEEILEVAMEPRHKVILQNEYVRALRVVFPPNDTTLAHRHAEDSLYFFLTQCSDDENKVLNVVNHVKGRAPACDCMEFGEVRFGTHKSEKPLIHKITNQSQTSVMLCIDAEVLKQPPVTAAAIPPLLGVLPHHELIKTRDKCRVYKLTLEPGASVTVTYPFFHLTVVLQPGSVQKETATTTAGGGAGGGGSIRWTETSELGDTAWKEPVSELTKTNVGSSTFVEFIAEWR